MNQQGGYFEHKQRLERNTREAWTIGRTIVGLISLIIVATGRLAEPLCCYRMGGKHNAYHAVVAALVFFIGPVVYMQNEPLDSGGWAVVWLLTAYMLHVAAMLLESFVRVCAGGPRVHSWDLGRPWPWFEAVGWIMLKIPVVKLFVPDRRVFMVLLFPIGLAGAHTLVWWRTDVSAWWIQGVVVSGSYLLWQLTLLFEASKRSQERRDQEIMAAAMQRRVGR
ncbi:MAG: hypothetical protein AAGB48_10440 [Planctomycetota bacterium]